MLPYDDQDALSIENYAKQLIGKTFEEAILINQNHDFQINEDSKVNFANKKRKGGLGEIIEKGFFHYNPNNDSSADFKKAGLELKVTPYKKSKNNKISAKERLVLTMINYFNDINYDFENSHLWKKSKLILLIYYLYEKEIINRLDYKINYVKIFTPPEKDLKIIKEDFKKIINKIKAGKAHELSESDTFYLGAAPKARNSKDRRKQPFSEILAKPRAFALKNSYMTYVLNNYIIPDKVLYNNSESILKNKIPNNFECYILNKINNFKDYSISDLQNYFDVNYKKNPKNLNSLIIYKILGINGNKAEEFIKANIVIKTVRLSKNNSIKESMSFPTFKFKELIKEECETSTFVRFLEETKFLFVIYKEIGNKELVLKGAQFWNMSVQDIEKGVYPVWQKTKDILIDGLNVIVDSKGIRHTNFPQKSFNEICHVRPHARNKYDTYPLPQGGEYMKHCFWLNNTYILSQLNKKFLK